MDIAAYYFPNYHADPRNEARHGKNWTEWELVKQARPRFPGHDQPKVPLGGYSDEADPTVMAEKIKLAAEHSIDAFVFDWYWYDGPYLQRALDEGFLAAPNRGRIKFALMWANHDWYDRHPVGRNTTAAPLLYRWSTTRQTVGFVWDYVIGNYLVKPGYWRVGGLPYFSIYATNRFISQMGGPEETAAVLKEFRDKAKRAGLPGIHINGVWADTLDGSANCVCPSREWAEKIGFSSYTSYNCIYHTPVWERNFPKIDFETAAREYLQLAEKAVKTLPAPYFPVATAGWDSSPRTVQSEIYESGGYPYCPVMEPDPEQFLKLLTELAGLQPRAIFINAWNEWTEGSYLEPDMKNKTDLLNAVQKFKTEVCHA